MNLLTLEGEKRNTQMLLTHAEFSSFCLFSVVVTSFPMQIPQPKLVIIAIQLELRSDKYNARL